MLIQTQSIFTGRIIDVRLETVRLPDADECELEVVRHPGGAAALALDEQQQVCLLRHYRPVIDDWLWELPAGKLEGDELPQLAAQRELREEAGIEASHWHALGSMHSTPGFCDEVVHLFLASGLTLGRSMPEAHEVLEVHWLPLRQALSMAADGEISDAKTVIALLRARAQGLGN
jgi:ADP-ribose pyrophosphatase